MTWIKLASYDLCLTGLVIIIYGWVKDADLVTFIGTFVLITPLILGGSIKMKRN